jgi:hypothetical protein
LPVSSSVGKATLEAGVMILAGTFAHLRDSSTFLERCLQSWGWFPIFVVAFYKKLTGSQSKTVDDLKRNL